MREIGLTPEYRIECLADLDGARTWLTADIENTAADHDNNEAFDALLAHLHTLDDTHLVGEHHADAYTFTVRAAVDCGCPCDCAAAGRACNGIHNREAAAEPQPAKAHQADEPDPGEHPHSPATGLHPPPHPGGPSDTYP